MLTIKDETIQSLYVDGKFVAFFKKEPETGQNLPFKPLGATATDIAGWFKKEEIDPAQRE